MRLSLQTSGKSFENQYHSLGIDKDKLLPISKGDEKKASCIATDLLARVTEAVTWRPLKAFAMLNRPKEMLPTKWKWVILLISEH